MLHLHGTRDPVRKDPHMVQAWGVRLEKEQERTRSIRRSFVKLHEQALLWERTILVQSVDLIIILIDSCESAWRCENRGLCH